MSHYIVCPKKRNNPRIDIRICERKCALKDDCEAYHSFHKAAVLDKEISKAADPQPVRLEAA